MFCGWRKPAFQSAWGWEENDWVLIFGLNLTYQNTLNLAVVSLTPWHPKEKLSNLITYTVHVILFPRRRKTFINLFPVLDRYDHALNISQLEATTSVAFREMAVQLLQLELKSNVYGLMHEISRYVSFHVRGLNEIWRFLVLQSWWATQEGGSMTQMKHRAVCFI